MTDAYAMGINPDARIIIPKSGSFVEVEKKLVTDKESDAVTSARLVYTYGNKQVGEAKLKLINIGAGSISEAESEAAEDPLLAKILGIEQAESTAAEGNAAGTEKSESKITESTAADIANTDNTGTENVNPDSTGTEGDGAVDLKGIIIKVLAAAAAIALLFIAFVCIRAVIAKRRAKIREQRRIARMRKNAYLSGEMHETRPVYRSSQRTLRKIKRKRKR